MVTDSNNWNVVKLHSCPAVANPIQTIAGSDHFYGTIGMSVSTEGLIYVYNYGIHCVTVYDEMIGKFLFALARKVLANNILMVLVTWQ